jgi:hypothetical protein
MAAWFAVGAALAATGVLAEKPARKARAAVGSTRSEYAIAQQGREMGSESILRTDYNDNTVVFGVHSRLEPAPETVMDQNVEFTVVEESFYPLGYRMAKRIDQGDSGITMEISIDMFANVAVMTSKSANAEGTSRIVLPTGARQNFDAMDVANGKEESLVVQLIAADTVSVGGEATPVDVYKLHRPYFEVTLYVDGAGRMVRAEQNFMTWDLKEWSHEAVKAQ